jgi:hypothetical protein
LSFRQEIQVLERACQQHQEELKHLQSVYKEQTAVSHQLDDLREYLAEEQNALELEARAFDSIHPLLANRIQQVEQEVEALEDVRLHSALFDLVVDKQRGLRYPLINDLRLAYRPKGDLEWKEIKAAWAQVLQLLLFVGTSVQFRSKNWRIVPLTFGARLMYISDANNTRRREVYSFSDDHHSSIAPSLRALTALLDQLIHHVKAKLTPTLEQGEDMPPIPYETSRNRIGSHDLSRLEDDDDSGWSRVIHCIASNLQWLAERASDWEALQCLVATTTTA